MRTHPGKNARPTPSPTWPELTRRLAIHINWLEGSLAQTKASRTRIEQWRKQLNTFPAAETAQRPQRGGQR
jgi:hypothetical protein